jgi:hypothetical protein
MIHPDTETRFIDEVVGRGVFALRPIPAGTVTWVRDVLDRTFGPADLAAVPPMIRDILDTYSYRDPDGRYVFCWDHARFMNHSGHANCLLTAYGLEIAVRDIAAGEELTNDYGCFNIIEPFVPCAEEGGRDTVFPDDLTRCHADWDARTRAAVIRLPGVAQPLRPLVPDAVWEELTAVAAGRAPLRSVASLALRAP